MPFTAHKQKVAGLLDLLHECRLCPRHCRVDRTKGERGFCGLAADIVMDCAMPHHGEEPPISGSRGAGTIFLSSCNLKCLYCQNHQISHRIAGKHAEPGQLSDTMLSLQEQGCHNIELVTPTPQMPLVAGAFVEAQARGLTIPLVYNCGGYEDPDVVRLLENTVGVYLPDFKYGRADIAATLSGAEDYVHYAVSSIQEMVRQIGDGLEMADGIAQRGIIIRHLVLPDMISNSFDVLSLIKKHISIEVPVSIMAQYTPIPAVKNHPRMSRRITPEEYERVIHFALDLGFENIFCQDVDSRHLAPDFEQDMPFSWNQGEAGKQDDSPS